jgi:hypothetical protein
MNQQEYNDMVNEFHARSLLVVRDAQIATGYIWGIVPKTGDNRTIKEQHGLFMQPTDGIDNDHDGLIDEADEFVTKCDGGQSPHNLDLAHDLVPYKSPVEIYWKAPKEIWKAMADLAGFHGLVAGFYFKSFYDAPHVESARFRVARAAWQAGDINVG